MIKYDEIFHSDQDSYGTMRVIGETYDNRLLICTQSRINDLYKTKVALFSNRFFKTVHPQNSNPVNYTPDKKCDTPIKKKLPYKFRDLIEITKSYPQNIVSGDLSCDQCYLHLTALVLNKYKAKPTPKPKNKTFFSFMRSKSSDSAQSEKDQNEFHFESIIYELSTMKRSKKFQFNETIVGLFLPQHNHFYYHKIDPNTELPNTTTESETASMTDDSSSNSMIENRNEMLHFVGSRLNHIVVTSKNDQKRLTIEKLRGGIHIPNVKFWQFCRKDSILFVIYENSGMNVLSQFQFHLYQSVTSLSKSEIVHKDRKLKNVAYQCIPIGRKESIFVQIQKFSVLPDELSFYPAVNNPSLPFFRHNFCRYSFFVAKFKSKICLVQQLFANKESCISFNVSCYPKFFNRNFSVPGVYSMLPLTFMQKESILIVFVPNQFICLIDFSLTPPNVSILPQIYAEPRVYHQDSNITIDLIEKNRPFTKTFPSFATNLQMPNIIVDLESPSLCKLYIMDIDLSTIDPDLQKITRTSCDAFANICARLFDRPDQLASIFSLFFTMDMVQNTFVFVRDFFLYSRVIRDTLFNSEMKKLSYNIKITRSNSKLSIISSKSSNSNSNDESKQPSSPLSPRFNSTTISSDHVTRINSLPRRRAISTGFWRPQMIHPENESDDSDNVTSVDSYESQKEFLSGDSTSDEIWKKKSKNLSSNEIDSDSSDSDTFDSSSDSNLAEQFGEEESSLDDFSLSMKMKKLIRKSVHFNETTFPSSSLITRRHYFYSLLKFFIKNKENLSETSGRLHDTYALKSIECLEKQNKTSQLINEAFAIWFNKYENESDKMKFNHWVLMLCLLIQSEICFGNLPRVSLISEELVKIANMLGTVTIGVYLLLSLNLSPKIIQHHSLDVKKMAVSRFAFEPIRNITSDELKFWSSYGQSLSDDQNTRIKTHVRHIILKSSHFHTIKKLFLPKRSKK